MLPIGHLRIHYCPDNTGVGITLPFRLEGKERLKELNDLPRDTQLTSGSAKIPP